MKRFAESYFELLNGKYAGINLTRITEPEDFWNKQILDSIEPFNQSKIFRESINESDVHVDVGFGGGFPLLPLAYLNPQKEFVGIEARAKKAKVVDEIALELGLKNVNCHHIRIENLLIDVPCCITLKAVGKVYDFLSLINTKNKVKVFFYKGPNFTNIEADQIKKAKNEWSVIEDLEINVQGTEKRYIIGFENKNVPHGTTNKKGLISLASLKKA